MTDYIEYKIRPVTRYIVTRYTEGEGGKASETKGEFDNYATAYQIGYALAQHDYRIMGWSLDDNRIQFPKESPEDISSD